jgi:hypothetical protein
MLKKMCVCVCRWGEHGECLENCQKLVEKKIKMYKIGKCDSLID